jgi:hypothetical protein
MYHGAKAQLSQIMVGFIPTSGRLTDELMAAGLGTSPISIGAQGNLLDERIVSSRQQDGNFDGGTYVGAQGVRALAQQAIGLLAHYAPKLSPALRGEMYAVEGYAELLLGELFCSGIPLSTLDFQSDFTYEPSSSQTDVYQHAVTLFDSALAISSDSASVTDFASVAKGRALLDLGQYAEAAQAVAMVPTSSVYTISATWSTENNSSHPYEFGANCSGASCSGVTIPNREGSNGLPFNSTNDPRAQVMTAGTNPFGIPLFTPQKYEAGSTTPIVLASGIEARLIEAEAALQVHDTPTWLARMNALRTTSTTCTMQTLPCTAPAGTGGVPGLPLLVDPGSSPGDSARVSLLFVERGYWLFLTGHRQGDLRRLVRNYGRPENTVYPTGPYYGGFGAYGTSVNVPIPTTSEQANPLFHGCLDQGA